jgi:O-succinylbenzoic acid--CoA ligase
LAELGFYFDPERSRVDWDGSGTLAMANPEWLRRDRPSVESQLAALPGHRAHIWVATSGSSSTVPGHIRWVALSKEAFLASAAAVNAHLGAGPGDTWAHALPVFHVGGLGILARARLSGSRVVATVSGRWDARRFELRAREAGATLSALVPSQVHDLVAAGLHAPPSLRAVIVGGARLDPELCADARSLGWPCLPSYGLTETCSQVATASLERRLAAGCDTVLPVLAHAEIRADEEMRLRIRAASLLTCYAEATETGMRSWDPREDGWLATDDLGHIAAGGVEVLGRASDSVKVLGEVVWVHRIESAVRRWSAAQPELAAVDVAVAAVPHARLGHELVVVLAGAGRQRLDAADAARLASSLSAFCRGALLPYEQPHRIAWVEEIPRTPLGKVQRTLLSGQVGLEPRPEG